MNQSTSTITSEQRLLTPAEIARSAGCHRNSVVRIADDLRLEPIRTGHGDRLFTPAQAGKIVSEVERRRQEAMRR